MIHDTSPRPSSSFSCQLQVSSFIGLRSFFSSSLETLGCGVDLGLGFRLGDWFGLAAACEAREGDCPVCIAVNCTCAVASPISQVQARTIFRIPHILSFLMHARHTNVKHTLLYCILSSSSDHSLSHVCLLGYNTM